METHSSPAASVQTLPCTIFLQKQLLHVWSCLKTARHILAHLLAMAQDMSLHTTVLDIGEEHLRSEFPQTSKDNNNNQHTTTHHNHQQSDRQDKSTGLYLGPPFGCCLQEVAAWKSGGLGGLKLQLPARRLPPPCTTLELKS